MSSAASSPNFPAGLDIAPLSIRRRPPHAGTPASAHHPSFSDDDDDDWDQLASIGRFGIAGRLWEASLLLQQYLQPVVDRPLFDPPCLLFTHDPRSGNPRTVVELGSGVGYTSLQLTTLLAPTDLVVMTDLPEVVELMEARRSAFLARRQGAVSADVWVRALAWGQGMEAALFQELEEHGRRKVDLVLCSDVIYFPALYPPLLATLRALTSPPYDPPPDIVIAYKSRDLSREDSFWDMITAAGFSLTPVIHLPSGRAFGALEDDRMGIFIVRSASADGDAGRATSFEDLLFLSVGEVFDD